MTGAFRIVALTATVSAIGLGVASADTSTIESGTVSLYWDGSLSGFQLSGSGTQLNGEVLQSPPAFLTAGTSADLSGKVRPTQFGHPFSETVNGKSYSSVWVKGDFTFTARPFDVPTAADGTVSSFSTPFTMQGRFSGYADRAMTDLVFSVSLDAAGVVTSGPMRFSSRENAWTFAGSGSVSYTCTGTRSPDRESLQLVRSSHSRSVPPRAGADIRRTSDATEIQEEIQDHTDLRMTAARLKNTVPTISNPAASNPG
jgi:hypothetical protein